MRNASKNWNSDILSIFKTISYHNDICRKGVPFLTKQIIIIHPFRGLSRGPQTLPKWVFHRVRSSASFLNFHYPLLSLRSSTSCLRRLPCLPVISNPHSISHSVMCFRRQLLSQMCPIQLAFLFYCIWRYFFPPRLCVILPHFSHYRSNWSSQFFSSTTFENIPGIFDLVFEVPTFQHHTVLCSKCSILLFYSLNLSPIFWWKVSFSCWMLHYPWQSWI